MADKVQLFAHIRFQLEQLSAKNAHHEFEHLSRHFARGRIASNVLPATGPVSAGGDQGRDFETFRTFLSQGALAGRSFISLAADKVLVFACSLEKKKTLPAKIEKDVTTILEPGRKVDVIYYFAAADLGLDPIPWTV